MGAGAWGLDFWGHEYSSGGAGLCFCLLSREGLGFRFTCLPEAQGAGTPLLHLFVLHLPHSCAYQLPWPEPCPARPPPLPQAPLRAAPALAPSLGRGSAPAAAAGIPGTGRGWAGGTGVYAVRPRAASGAHRSSCEGDPGTRAPTSAGVSGQLSGLVPGAPWSPSRPPGWRSWWESVSVSSRGAGAHPRLPPAWRADFWLSGRTSSCSRLGYPRLIQSGEVPRGGPPESWGSRLGVLSCDAEADLPPPAPPALHCAPVNG